MATNQAVVSFIASHQYALIQTDFLREIWMIPDRLTATKLDTNTFTLISESPLYKGKLFVSGGEFYSIDSSTRTYIPGSDVRSYTVIASPTGIMHDPDESLPLCTCQDVITLMPGMIANYKGDTPVETSLGIFIANYLLLVYPFGDVIDYLNEEFSTPKLEKLIAQPILDERVSVRDAKDRYINTLSLIGQSNEMICPGISEKTISIPQSIHDLRERLVAENKDALEAGDASVMSDIEKQLIAAYKEHLKGDSSLHFLLKKKYFDVTLKKLFLTQGMTEVFGSPGKFTFIDNPMGNGWKQKDLASIFNEVRSGSYSRAVETAFGGVIAKLILRVLQDTMLSIPDCGTTRGEKIDATAENLKDFLWNYIVNADGTTTMISDENRSTYAGKTISIRTPGYCQSPQGFCAKCFGYLFEALGQKAFAPVANDFARNQTTASLKKMHGVSNTVVDVSNINRYLI